MTTAIVSRVRPYAVASQIAAGAYVRGPTWSDMAGLGNYLRGMGAVLIPNTLLLEQITAGGNATIRARIRPTIHPHRRRWSLHLRGVSGPGVATVQVPSGGTSQSIPFSATRQGAASAIQFSEDVSSPSTSEAELTCKITAPGGTAVEVVSYACCEVPRTSLIIGGSELGVDLASVAPLQPIEATLADRSVGGVVKSVLDSTYGAAFSSRRVGMHHWGSFAGKVFSTGAYVNAYSTGGEAPVLAQRLRSTDASSTTRTIYFRVYATASSGTTFGSIRATAGHGGATGTINNIANTLQWWPAVAGAPASIAVDREDLSTADGLVASTFDTLQWAGKITAGAGNMTVYAVSFWTDTA